jgi:lysozyme
MKTSIIGLNLIKGVEGLRLVPYNDATGNATVGYGHLLHRGPLDGTEVPITADTALDLLAQDVHSRAEVWVDEYVRAPLSQNQYDALVSFCFNCGAKDLRTVVSETGLNNGDYSAVPPKILLYDKARNQQGQLVRLPGLTKRRTQEAELFEA